MVIAFLVLLEERQCTKPLEMMGLLGIQLRSFQYAIDKIKKNEKNALLYIHKPGPLPQGDVYLNELADIYIRGLLEVDAFIQDNLEKEDESDDL